MNCNCWLSQVFDSDYFKNYQPSEELLQSVQDDPRFPEFKSWATGWLEKIGAEPVAAASLTSLTVSELRAIAADIGIEGTAEMSHNELINAINQARNQ